MFKEVNKGSESEKEVTTERLDKERHRNERNIRHTARARLRSVNLLLTHSQENVEDHMGAFKGQAWKWHTLILLLSFIHVPLTRSQLHSPM